jgi:uncharacterized BrkB/YihY/UPF0761 family membrane protein
MKLQSLNRVLSFIAVFLSISVAIPLTIKVIIEGGGPWGFEVVSLAILIPLSCYLLFGIAGILRDADRQKKVFIAGPVKNYLKS